MVSPLKQEQATAGSPNSNDGPGTVTTFTVERRTVERGTKISEVVDLVGVAMEFDFGVETVAGRLKHGTGRCRSSRLSNIMLAGGGVRPRLHATPSWVGQEGYCMNE